MKVKKAVITAAGPNQHRLPLQRFVDLNGQEKTALQIVVEEVAAAGVEEICVVVRCGDQQAYAEAAGEYARMLTFVEQPRPRGYGEALYRAARFVGDEPFVHLVSDHLYISAPDAAPAPAIGRGGPGGKVPGLGRAGHAGEHAAVLRRRGRPPGRRTHRPVYDRTGAGKAHPHRGRAIPGGSGASRGPLPVPVRDARAHARRDGDPRPVGRRGLRGRRRRADHALPGPGETGSAGAIPGAGTPGLAVQHRREVRHAHRPIGPGPPGQGPGRDPRPAGGTCGRASAREQCEPQGIAADCCEVTDASRPDRNHHQRRRRRAQPAAGRLLPGRHGRRVCWRPARGWIASAAPARTSTSGSGRCSS